MAVDTQKIIELLGTGLSNDVVASAIGCTPGYISQLLADEAIAEKVITLRTTHLTANNKRDGSIDALEDKLLVQAHKIVDEGLIYKPREIIGIMGLVNKMQRRGVPAHQSLQVNQQVVNITLPATIIREFTTSSTGEVIEVTTEEGKQSLRTMPAQQLLQQLSRDRKGGDKYEQLRKFLPSSSGSNEAAGE